MSIENPGQRMGVMGHYYSGMLDIYSDLTLQSATFGTHVEIIEVDELSAIRREVEDVKISDRVSLIRSAFTNSRYRFPIGARRFMQEWNQEGAAHHCAIGVGRKHKPLAKVASLLGIACVRSAQAFRNINVFELEMITFITEINR